ncbi:hypothetical protein [Peribacillus butanolivorans]|uniref:hypothetical protein n=1 Tax=Peribacillus butanolivorans TaxID=421767 RepID=UPI0036DFA12C
MSSHNYYEPNWNYYRQGQRVSRQQGGSLDQASIRAQGSNLGTQAHGGMSHPSPSQDSGSHGQGSTPGYSYPSYPTSSYNGHSSDMQHMFQMLNSLGNQLDQLSKLIAQNNQLLQSMHDQEDTKCVQGGGGTVIVRM